MYIKDKVFTEKISQGAVFKKYGWIGSSLSTLCSEVEDIYETYKDDDEQYYKNIRNLLLEYDTSTLSISEWNNVIEVISQDLIQTLNDKIKDFSNMLSPDSEEFFSQFIIPEKSANSISSHIKKFVNNNLEPYYKKLNQDFNKLQNMKIRIREMESNGNGIGDFVMSFGKGAGLGALAIAVPIVGVPLLAGNIIKSFMGNKKDDIFIEEFCNLLKSLIGTAVESRSAMFNIVGNIYSYMEEKLYQHYEQLKSGYEYYLSQNPNISKKDFEEKLFSDYLTFSNNFGDIDTLDIDTLYLSSLCVSDALYDIDDNNADVSFNMEKLLKKSQKLIQAEITKREQQ